MKRMSGFQVRFGQALGIAAMTGVTTSVCNYYFASQFSTTNNNTQQQLQQKPMTSSPSSATQVVKPVVQVQASKSKQNVEDPDVKAIRDAAGDLAKLRGPYPDDVELPDHPIYRVAVTGGPCAGKSTGMSKIKEEFEKRGFKVFISTEVATVLITGGLDFGYLCQTEEGAIEAQRLILEQIVSLEDTYYRLALKEKKPCIILCDRGTMDGRVYCSDSQFKEVLRRTGWSLDSLRDVRYDQVIHMVTAAIGAEAAYTKSNNAARRETIEEAAAVDEKTKHTYMGHRSISVIDNSTGFKEKLQRTCNVINNLVSVPRNKFSSKKIYPIEGPGEIETTTPTATEAALITANAETSSTAMGTSTSTSTAAEGKGTAKKTTTTKKKSNIVVDENRKIVLPSDKVEETFVTETTMHVLFPRKKYQAEHLLKRSTPDSDIYYLRATLKETGQSTYLPVSSRDYSIILQERKNEQIPVITRRHENFFCGLNYWSITSWLKGPNDVAGKMFLEAQEDVDAAKELPFLKLGAPVKSMTKSDFDKAANFPVVMSDD